MASTKATRRAKRDICSKGKDKGYGSDSSSSAIIKNRRVQEGKDADTNGAVKKSNAKGKGTREYVLKAREAPPAQNGRTRGRQLIRWNVATDQILLLVIEHECRRANIRIPWEAVAKRLANEKGTTGACVSQHITKLRKEMLARGSWVPPLGGKLGEKPVEPNVRGLVKEMKNGEMVTRELGWDEDAFRYVDCVHINPLKQIVGDRPAGNDEDASGDASGVVRAGGSVPGVPQTRESAMEVDDNAADPADLPSDDEYDPASNGQTKYRMVTRASAKFGRNSRADSEGTNSSVGDKSGPRATVERDDSGTPVMMDLFKSDGVKFAPNEYEGIAVLELGSTLLQDFPNGVPKLYKKHAYRVSPTNRKGEESYFNDDSDLESNSPNEPEQNRDQAGEDGIEESHDQGNESSDSEEIFLDPYQYRGKTTCPAPQKNQTSSIKQIKQGPPQGFIEMDNQGSALVNNEFDQVAYGQPPTASNDMDNTAFDQIAYNQIPAASSSMDNNAFDQVTFDQTPAASSGMNNNEFNQNYVHPAPEIRNLGPINSAGTFGAFGGKRFAEILDERDQIHNAMAAGLIFQMTDGNWYTQDPNIFRPVPANDPLVDNGHASHVNHDFVLGNAISAANDHFAGNETSFANPHNDGNHESYGEVAEDEEGVENGQFNLQMGDADGEQGVSAQTSQLPLGPPFDFDNFQAYGDNPFAGWPDDLLEPNIFGD